MMTARLISIGMGAALGLLAGCATSGPVSPVRTSNATAMAQAPSTRQAMNGVFYWREQARELHDMADRREREADLLSKSEQGTTVNEDVARMRSLAKQLRAAAEYADAQAQEAQRLIPKEMAR